MYKLLMRAFPGFYRANSVYALYPFSTPDRIEEIFTQHGTPHNIPLNYSAPSPIGNPIPVLTWRGVVDVLHDQQRFKVPCKSSLNMVRNSDDRLTRPQGAITYTSCPTMTSCYLETGPRTAGSE